MDIVWLNARNSATSVDNVNVTSAAPCMACHTLSSFSARRSRAIAFPGPASPDPGARVIIQEGIVPGLDFCNHARDSCCHWTVAGPGGALRPGVPPTEIRLVCPRGCALDPGLEVTIAYGEQSNEELLFNYGFAELDNPNEVLMVACPLPPPGEWDTTLQSRVALLQARGLSPQIFLPAQHLTPEERGGCRRRKGHIRYHGRRGRDRELAGPGAVQALVCDEAVQELDLPAGVMETLEVFVMEPKDVLAELDGTAQGSGAAAGRTQSAHSMGELEQSGLRLALLTTLVRLLELKVDELENPATGTGPLEDDEKMVEGGTAGEVSGHRRQALVYRLGQKKVARQYLIYANELLQQEMRHLRAISVDR